MAVSQEKRRWKRRSSSYAQILELELQRITILGWCLLRTAFFGGAATANCILNKLWRQWKQWVEVHQLLEVVEVQTPPPVSNKQRFGAATRKRRVPCHLDLFLENTLETVTFFREVGPCWPKSVRRPKTTVLGQSWSSWFSTKST